ncbi:uncharacterized protein J3D65DRAFT_675313 [Phyllosticta citribraziliensis]|uniref:Uncharacterized protein n=1 Tax=Phyllosticta citribraziliensis TaxID=989973 RepID=A0ABR1M126_9PEZI
MVNATSRAVHPRSSSGWQNAQTCCAQKSRDCAPIMSGRTKRSKTRSRNSHNSEQTQQINSLREELKGTKISKNDDEKNVALEAKIQEELLYSVEQMYDEVLMENASQEKDDFLAKIKEGLGSGRYSYFRRIGKMICEEGLDFPELEMYQVKMEAN